MDTGLRVTSLQIQEKDGGRSVDCGAGSQDPSVLYCYSLDDFGGGTAPVAQTLPTQIAQVANAAPALDGPELRGLTVDAAALTVAIDAVSPSGVYAAEILTAAGTRLTVYPDDLAGGRAVSLAPIAQKGWNTITAIVLYDANGLPTLYRQTAGPAALRSGGGTLDEAPAAYEEVGWRGSVKASGVPVVTFLNSGGMDR